MRRLAVPKDSEIRNPGAKLWCISTSIRTDVASARSALCYVSLFLCTAAHALVSELSLRLQSGGGAANMEAGPDDAAGAAEVVLPKHQQEQRGPPADAPAPRAAPPKDQAATRKRKAGASQSEEAGAGACAAATTEPTSGASAGPAHSCANSSAYSRAPSSSGSSVHESAALCAVLICIVRRERGPPGPAWGMLTKLLQARTRTLPPHSPPQVARSNASHCFPARLLAHCDWSARSSFSYPSCPLTAARMSNACRVSNACPLLPSCAPKRRRAPPLGPSGRLFASFAGRWAWASP